VRDRFHDSLHHRELPGDGELPVLEYLQRMAARGPLPPVGPEIFNDRLVAMPAMEAALACAHAARRLIREATLHSP
jgi:hypothetical protein